MPASADPHRFTDNYKVIVTDGEVTYQEHGWSVTTQWRTGAPGCLNSSGLVQWTNASGETKSVLGEEFVALLPRLTSAITRQRRMFVVPRNPADTGEFNLSFEYDVDVDGRGEQLTYREKDRSVTMFWASMTNQHVEISDIRNWFPSGVPVTALERAAIIDRLTAYMQQYQGVRIRPR